MISFSEEAIRISKLTSEKMVPSTEKAAMVPPIKKAAGRKRATAVMPATVAKAKPMVLAAIVSTSGPAQSMKHF